MPTAPVPAQALWTPPPSPAPRPAPVAPPWWQRDGAVARVLSAVGAGVLLIGITCLLVLAAQHGYLGPVPRAVLGGAVAAVLMLLGLVVQRRQPGNAGAVALVATGVAGGYLDLVAVTTIYGWVPLGLGLAAAAVLFAVGLVIARRWHSQVLAVIAVLGVVILAPAVGHDRPWQAAAFVILVSTAATWAHRDRRWPVLQAARVAPTLLVLIGCALVDESAPLVVGRLTVGIELVYAILAAVFAVASVLGERWLVHRARAGVVGTVMVGLSALPALLLTPWASDQVDPTVWLVTLAAFWVAAATAARRPALVAVLLSAAAAGVVVALAEVARVDLAVPGALAAATAYLAVGLARGRRVVGWVGIGVGVLALLAYLPIVEPLLSGPDLAASEPTFDLGDLLGSVLALGVAVLGTVFASTVLRGSARTWALVAGWAAGLLAVAGSTVSTGVLLGEAVGRTGSGFVAGQAVATLSWMAGAAWLLLRRRQRTAGGRTAGRRDLTVGMALAGLAVAKLMLFDLSTLDGLIRVLAFVVAGGVLLALGTLYARSISAVRERV